MTIKKMPVKLDDFTDLLDFDKVEEEPKQVAESNDNGVMELELSKMQSFPNHKFKLYEGQQLEDMVCSIKEFGIIMPIILWQKDDEYIILSGHNRKNAAECAGLEKAPVIIKQDLNHEEAVLIVTETNLRQRSFSDLSHSERAYCLAEHYEAMKSQGKRNDILDEVDKLLNTDEYKENETSAEVQSKLRNDEKLGAEYGLSRDKVAKYIRIATLDKLVVQMLDENSIGFLTAYTLSFVKDTEKQNIIADLAMSQNYNLDMAKANLLRQYFESKKLTEETIDEILSGEKTKKPKSNKPKPIKVKDTVIKKYFNEGETAKEIEDIIEKALEAYFATIE